MPDMQTSITGMDAGRMLALRLLLLLLPLLLLLMMMMMVMMLLLKITAI